MDSVARAAGGLQREQPDRVVLIEDAPMLTVDQKEAFGRAGLRAEEDGAPVERVRYRDVRAKPCRHPVVAPLFAGERGTPRQPGVFRRNAAKMLERFRELRIQSRNALVS
jgi:hypothetical protein